MPVMAGSKRPVQRFLSNGNWRSIRVNERQIEEGSSCAMEIRESRNEPSREARGGHGYVQVTSQWLSRSVMKTLPASTGSREQVCDAGSSFGPGQICAIQVGSEIRREQSFSESNGSRPLIKRFSVSGQMRLRDASLLVGVGGLNAESK